MKSVNKFHLNIRIRFKLISIKKYNNKLQKIWDDFVLQSKYGTIFHNQKFLSYHIEKNFTDFSLMFYEKNILIAVLPACLINKNKKNILVSHSGASFGGFLVKKEGFDLYNKILFSFEKHCVKNKIHKLKIIPTPSYYSNKADSLFDYVSYLHDYKVSEKYISHIIYLKNKKALNCFNQRKKRYLKNFLINNPELKTEETKDFSGFYKLLKENKKKFSVKPTHSQEELKEIKKLYPEQCIFLSTCYKKKLIGGFLIIKTAQSSALLFYNFVEQKCPLSNVGTYQIYQSIKFCIKNNLTILDLGVSQLPNNKNPLDPKHSLIKFKEQCGGVGLVRSVYEKQTKVYNEK